MKVEDVHEVLDQGYTFSRAVQDQVRMVGVQRYSAPCR